ncbi:Na+/H+ antiporter NhaC family protein [Bacilliculturomica massiliensis]|uniref:Na+/H+ antiporter NhaC family protein n=1 Tax=Bacilliculturomica massiliensis TaxID=1917867 RepID=UPI0010311203|nr:Na+/H+ antiporter NhaC family protein [Bacilliculturomica massiliensis]
METVGVLSLLPPILAIVLAILTKQVLISLFAGIWIGATLLCGFNPIDGLMATFGDYIFPSMGDPSNAAVIFMAMFCGSFALLLEKGGGAHAFAERLTKKVKTSKQAQVLAAAGGTAIFFSDSSNPVLVGPIFKPITDALKVSREKLAYICDATTATMPSMFPFTAWGAYIISIIAQQFEQNNVQANPMGEFVKAVPFSFYTIGAVIMVYMIAISGFDFGPMKKAEDRARLTGKLVDDGDASPALIRQVILPEGSKPTMSSMIVPLLVLVGVIFAGFLWTGDFPNVGVMTALANASTTKCLVVGFFVASIVAAVYTVRNKVMTPKEAVDTFFEGIRMMMDAVLILTLSWAIGSVCKAVGTTAFVIAHTENFLTPTVMYIAVFVIAAFTAFTTGTSWGTFAIFLPISIPLALAINAPLGAAIGTVISGGIFGDHCSPISDTTVLSSMGASCNHIAHVKTQLPYALCVAAAAAVAYLATGLMYNTLGATGSAILGIAITVGLSFVIAVTLCKMEGGRIKDQKASA